MWYISQLWKLICEIQNASPLVSYQNSYFPTKNRTSAIFWEGVCLLAPSFIIQTILGYVQLSLMLHAVGTQPNASVSVSLNRACSAMLCAVQVWSHLLCGLRRLKRAYFSVTTAGQHHLDCNRAFWACARNEVRVLSLLADTMPKMAQFYYTFCWFLLSPKPASSWIDPFCCDAETERVV